MVIKNAGPKKKDRLLGGLLESCIGLRSVTA
jgi:hypothetical protein